MILCNVFGYLKIAFVMRLHETIGMSTAFQMSACFDVQRGKYLALTELHMRSLRSVIPRSNVYDRDTMALPILVPSQRTRAVVELGISSEPDARILPTTDTMVHAFSNDAILDCVNACLLSS